MGLHDRPYWKEEQGGGPGGGLGGVRLSLPRPGRPVKILLFINLAVFAVQMFVDQPRRHGGPGPMSMWLGASVGGYWQVWRYVTFQFLHADFWHIALNMLGLYMLGSPLETTWGARRFLVFYLGCGVAAGLAYVVIAALFEGSPWRPLIGASGGVFGIILACAVLFPHFRLIFVIFPVPIRLAAAIIFGAMILMVLQSASAAMGGDSNAMGAAMSDVAHLGGAAAAAVWIWVLPKLRGTLAESQTRRKQGAWRRKMEQRADEQAAIDRILDKIKQEGLNSLSEKEKRTLQNATRRQRDEEPDARL
jgi:membrane associated rhomboid family serine protease